MHVNRVLADCLCLCGRPTVLSFCPRAELLSLLSFLSFYLWSSKSAFLFCHISLVLNMGLMCSIYTYGVFQVSVTSRKERLVACDPGISNE